MAIQIATDRVAGLELQPLAQLSAPLSRLAEAGGWKVSSEHDPQLGAMTVVALHAGDGRYLLRSYAHSVDAVTEVHTPDSGHPTDQLRNRMDAVPELVPALQLWWDGASWRPAPLPRAA
jgi:hypothetical protein